MTEEQPGRNDLSAWWQARPNNYFDATPNLARVLDRWAGGSAREKMEPALREFGATVATVVEPAVVTLEGHRELPVHVPLRRHRHGPSRRSSSTRPTRWPVGRSGRRGCWPVAGRARAPSSWRRSSTC